MFWKTWILFVFDILADPQSCNPYVHIGFRRVLYTSSFVFKLVNLFFVNIVFSDLDRALRINLLALICLFHVNFWSRINPKYLTALSGGIGMLLIETFGHWPCLRVKVVWTDLLWFTFIRHFSYHSDCRFKWDCKLVEAIIGSLWIEKITLSSA